MEAPLPRTGGVYSPPAGTKGVPNTTIQSVPYNALIDDLTADANAARPITAGGTGATSASAARTALGAQTAHAALTSISGLTTSADRMIYTTAADAYATTALTPFARTLLGDANAAAALTTLGVSAFMQTLLNDADAAAARATLGANDASNLTAGTVPDARISGAYSGITTLSVSGKIATSGNEIEISGGNPRLKFTDTTSGAYDFWAYVDSQNFHVLVDRTGNGAWDTPHPLQLEGDTNIGYLFGSQILTAGNYDALGVAPEARTITAGNGLTGGGDLAANRTLTLGTPGSITNSTTNSVTPSSHTHALGFTAAEVYTGTGANDTSFPLGHIILCYTNNIARNASVTPSLRSNLNYQYLYSGHTDAGSVLSGTWRARGTNGDGWTLLQRVA
ncbi:hypothetical protein LCM4579_06350 [Ensifer sp. LCM 4579]|nr:hypothetical protein LCM4579_06350 [Ensifer sp. LCM 4579]